jgi:integrase/recombinase XerD
MTALAPTLQAFFTERLIRQSGASPNTILAYRRVFTLLLKHILATASTPFAALDISDLSPTRVAEFLDYLEHDRGNSIRTRNARLAAIHSFFGYAAIRHPEHAEQISQVLAIPPKRWHRTDITYLKADEILALLAAPDQRTRTGRRDHALILTAVTTGLRVSELTGLTWPDVRLGPGGHLLCHGKGRKDRVTPLTTETSRALAKWHRETSDGTGPVLPTRTGTTMSTDAVAARITLHTTTAARTCPTLANRRVTPHVLRHTAAMRLLQAGVDVATIALWLGHESTETTQIYLHADLALKQKAINRTRPTGTPTGRYQADDQLLTFLQSL